MLIIADLRAMGDAPAATRRVAAETARDIPYRGVFLYGASFQTRIIAKLALGAMHLIGATTDCPVEFFETKREARAWAARRWQELEGRSR